MEIKQGYSYHVKDEFFQKIHDDYLMANKEDGRYRPHFAAIKDKTNEQIYWLIPISSKVEKYKKIVEKKTAKYGKCNTIIIGMFAEKEAAFLIQNAFPIIGKYIDHIHLDNDVPVKIQKTFYQLLVANFTQVLNIHKRGNKLIFPNIEAIEDMIKKEI